MIIRAKTKGLFQGKPLTEKQQQNSDVNVSEMNDQSTILTSLPRRLVFELTNNCNLSCRMCGRNYADFKPSSFRMEWFNYFIPFFDIVEEVTLMGWGEPTIHPNFVEMLSIIDQHSARKYFCTNGMRLAEITKDLFDYEVDVFGVSIDGATAQTNDRIRLGSDFNKIVASLRNIIKIRESRSLKFPHINFVFCAMKSNLHELSKLVELAFDIGLDEVKVVYLTAFDNRLSDEVLWDHKGSIQKEFNNATEIAHKLNVLLKLPHLPGDDPAGNKSHKDCFVAYRDLFVGSDGFIRPCMSTPDKFFLLDTSKNFFEFWNTLEYQEYRKCTNNEQTMNIACRKCYQSSHCNWNKKEAFIQSGNTFSPKWE